MRRSTLGIIVAVVLIGIVAAVIALTSGSTSTGNDSGLGQFAVPAGSADSRPLGEIGPGSCWPGDERPSGGKAAGFATSDGPAKAAKWLRENPAAAERLDRHLNAYAGYYLITEVVPEWDKLSPVERTAQYVSKMKAVKMTTMIRVLNTYCKGNDVVAWEVQILPVDEWVFFIPGHEPGTADPRPAFKGVCGNPLLPPPPPAPQQPVQPTTPGRPGCQTCTATPPPPPGCNKPCTPTTTIWKDPPSRDPNAQGNAPVGGGANADPGPGVQQPYTPPPNTPYVPPPPPPANPGPPAGSTPTDNAPPPPETGADPDDGSGNTGDPGGF